MAGQSLHVPFLCGVFNAVGFPLLVGAGCAACVGRGRGFGAAAVFVAAAACAFLVLWALMLNVNPYPLSMLNKYEVLRAVPPEFRPGHAFLPRGAPRGAVLAAVAALELPVVAKPAVCSKLGLGVVVLRGGGDVEGWASANARPGLQTPYIVQEYVDLPVELGVLVERDLVGGAWRVVSVVEKLGAADVRRTCDAGGECRERPDLARSPEMHRACACVRVASSIPGFNVGRYDVRTTEAMARAGRFVLAEVNGTMGFDLRFLVGDAGGLRAAALCEAWILRRMLRGLLNALSLRGYGPATMLRVMALALRNSLECRDWEKLFAAYS